MISGRVFDQIIAAATALDVQANATKAKILFGWIIERHPPEHPGKYIARFATTHPTIYVMVADTLTELQAILPPGPGAVTSPVGQSARCGGDLVQHVGEWRIW